MKSKIFILMKLILITIVLMLNSLPTNAQTTYYVSSSGNDANNGTSPGTPWKHLNKISTTTFSPGDFVLFKRGDTLYGEISKQGAGFVGTETNPIVFATYGTGAKPILIGDCSEGSWIKDTRRDSLWKKWIGRSHAVQGYEYYNGVWNLMTDNNSNTKWYLSNADSLEKFLNLFSRSSYDACTYSEWDTVYVRSHDGNEPNVILFRNNVWTGSWLIIRDLDFRSYKTPIHPYPMMNGIVRNCEFRDSRYISVYLAGRSSHNLVDSCTVHNGGYTGMYSWYCHRNRFAHDTIRNISETVRGTVGGAEHAGIGLERDTATVIEYCVIENCSAGGIDAFYDMQDTIRYCTINQINKGGIYPNGDSWVVHDNTITASTAISVTIGRYHGLPVGELGQMHIYNNTITVSPTSYGPAGTGLSLSSNGDVGTFANGSAGTILFENNNVTGTSNSSNLCYHNMTLRLTSINNHFFSPGRFNASAWPNEVFYYTLAEFQAATGLESGSTIDGIVVPTGTFTATPDTLPENGGTVILRWSSNGADSASISPNIGSVTTTGEDTIQVNATTTFVLTLKGSGGLSVYIARVVVENTPTLILNPTSLSFGNVVINTSSERTYTLSGSNLTPSADSLTIIAPAGFTISTISGSGFTSSKRIAYAGGTLSSTVIYVRFSPMVVQSYTGNIINDCGGATTTNVSVTGTGISNAAPVITVNPRALAFSTVRINTISSDRTYTVQGSNLSPASDSLTITAPAGFTISTVSDSGFASSKRIAYTGGTLSAKTIYVKFSPTAVQHYTGNITNTGGGAPTKNVAVSGIGIPTISSALTVNPTSLSFGNVIINTTSSEMTYVLTGLNLTPASDSLTITAPPGFTISTVSGSGFASSKRISYTGGTLQPIPMIIYVRFSPTAVENYTGNITNDGGGAAEQTITISGSGIAAPPPPTGTFIASSDTLPASGGSLTLAWTSQNAISASIDQGIGVVATDSGHVLIYVDTTTVYVLTLIGPLETTTLTARVVVLTRTNISRTNIAPLNYILRQNYPNPFNPITRIEYELPQAGFTTLKIYNSSGEMISLLVSEYKHAGKYSVEWDATKLSSGVYFYRLQSGICTETKKLIFIK